MSLMQCAMRRALQVQGLRQHAAAAAFAPRRTYASKVDPLDMDEDPEDEPEGGAAAAEAAAGAAADAEAEAEDPAVAEARKAAARGPAQVYTFGSRLNGRTGTNVGSVDLRLRPWTVQQPTRIEFFDNFEVKSVAGYHKHYLALLEDGRVFAWGSNNYGQLGCGDSSSFPKDRHAPVLVRTEDGEPLQDIVQISAGKYHSAAVDKHGRVYTWGYGGRKVRFVTPGHLLGYAAPKGALLNYSPFARPIPDFGPENGMEVEGDEPKPFVEGQTINPKATKVACGSIHTAVLDSAGRAWTWGYGEWGRLGHDDNDDRVRPTPVVAFLDEKTGLPRTPLSDVEVSESISSFVTQGGDVYVCGSDTTRQLGFGIDEQGLRSARFEAVNVPQHVNGVNGVGQVSFGSHAALALTKTGVPYYWGEKEARGPQAYADFGQRSTLKVSKLSCGTGPMQDHRGFITTDGMLYLTGANFFGQSLADPRPRDGGRASLWKYIRSWKATHLSRIAVDTQYPLFFQDKYAVDVVCGNNSTVVIAQSMGDEEISERLEKQTVAIEEYREAEERRSGKAAEKKEEKKGRQSEEATFGKKA